MLACHTRVSREYACRCFCSVSSMFLPTHTPFRELDRPPSTSESNASLSWPRSAATMDSHDPSPPSLWTAARLAVLACFAGWLWIANARKMTRATFVQVTRGMTREEVIRTVGGLPGTTHGRYEEWLCDDGRLAIYFDDEGRADDAMVYALSRPPSPSESVAGLACE
jgi:hypothetical protein